jgi:hypothetical protein
MVRGERKTCIGRSTLDGNFRTKAVYRTDCKCVKENGDSESDGSKWIEKNGDKVSDGSKWLEGNGDSIRRRILDVYWGMEAV